MKTTASYVALQFSFGLVLPAISLYMLHLLTDMDLLGGILYSILLGYFSMFLAVVFVGYFHLRSRHMANKFLLASCIALVGFILGVGLHSLIGSTLGALIPGLEIFLPLTGAIFGFNCIVVKYAQ